MVAGARRHGLPRRQPPGARTLASPADVRVAAFRITKGPEGLGIKRAAAYARAAGLKVTGHQTPCDDVVQLVVAYPFRGQYQPADGVEIPASCLLRWAPYTKNELVKEAS